MIATPAALTLRSHRHVLWLVLRLALRRRARDMYALVSPLFDTLTDHSGIGNPHADPHVDQYEVKTLRDHMLEVIRIELGAGQPTQQPREDVYCGLYHGRHDAPTWWDRHGLFVFVLGATFLFGFAGDTVLSQMRARRER